MQHAVTELNSKLMYATELFTLIDNISIAVGNEKTGDVTVPEAYLPSGGKIIGILSQSVRNASSSGIGVSGCNLYDLRPIADRNIAYQCFNLGGKTAKIRIQVKLLYTF